MSSPPSDLAQTSSTTLAWEARPVRALAKLAGPITLSGFSFAIMGVVDTLLVGALGATELAGVGLGIVVTNGLMGFGFGLLRGVKILLAQARGRGADHSAHAYVGAGVLVALTMGIAAMALGELAALIVPHFTASAAAGQAARRYIAVRSLGMPLILAYVALREARYGYGETRSPLVSALVGNVVHAVLDVLALYVLRWGAAGAALANVLAFTLQAALLWSAQRAASGRALTFGPAELAARWEVVRAGAFTGLQWALEIGSLLTLSLLLAGVSDHDMAAHQIAVQLAAFCFLPALAIGESATVLSAEAVGRGRGARVREVAHAARKLALAYAALCALVLGGAGSFVAGLFTDDPSLRALVRTVLLVAAAHQLFEALALSGHGVLRGVGASRLSALCALGCAWLCTPWVGYLLVRVVGLGAPGAWIARSLEFALASFIVWRAIERGRFEAPAPLSAPAAAVVTAGIALRESRPSIAA